MKFSILLVISLILLVVEADNESPRVVPATRFVVVSPFRIRPGKPFNVLIARSGAIKAITVKTTITSTSPEFSPIVRSTRISTLISRAFVAFDVSKVPPGEYFLTVDGEGYSETRALTYAKKDSSILIQLNKALFSPNQLVQGRVFAIDIDTNAVTPQEDCKLKIIESAGNVVNRKKIQFKNGRFEFSLQLSNQPPLGSWHVNVECGDEITTKSFDVEEFKLPAYDLIVTIPPITPQSQDKIPVDITAEYTTGKSVNGQGLFTIESDGVQLLNRTVTVVNGRASFDIDMNLLHEGNFEYFFNMKDSTLESSEIDEGVFQVVDSSYRLAIVGSNLISPGSPYNFTVIITQFDGRPAPAGSQIAVTINPLGTQLNLISNVNGTAPALINIPKNSTFIEITATAQNSISGFFTARAPAIGSFIDLFAGENKRSLGELVQIILTVSDDIEFVNYIITSKGVTLASDQVTFSVGKRQTSIWFRPNFNYAASCQVLAFYVNKNGDIITGRTSFEFRDTLRNFVKLNFEKAEVKPGDDFSFNVESECDSTVSLTAIDQRSFLLRQSQNILKEDVFTQLSKYESVDGIINEIRPYTDYESQFNNAGLMTFTNIPPDSNVQIPVNMLRAALPSASKTVDNKIKTRKNLSETFCWTNVVTKSAKNCTAPVSCKVPESLTSYFVYAVAMNAKNGLGLTETPSTITTIMPFYMVLDVPASINRNEILTLDIAFFNNIDQDQAIDISIAKNDFFTGVDIAADGWDESSKKFTRTFYAQASTDFRVKFTIKLNLIGNFNLKVTAKGPLAGDTIQKSIRVQPVGIPRSITSSALLAVGADSQATASLQCAYPNGVYEDTEEVFATVEDLFGANFNNFEDLITGSSGDLSSILLQLSLDVEIHEFLHASNRLTLSMDEKLRGYEQRLITDLLTYKLDDGGFSADGIASSTWQTAQIIKTLLIARHFVPVDIMEIIENAANFVISQQQSDGSFVEFNNSQGSEKITLTAYVSIELMNLLTIYPQYAEKTGLALDFLTANIASVTNVYELGIASYALILAGYEPQAMDAFNRFNTMRFETSTTIEWMVVESELDYQKSSSLDVEVAAYALRSLIEYGRQVDANKVARFLITNINKSGGLKLSQDTVLILDALTFYVRNFGARTDIQLTLTPNIGPSIDISIDDSNALALQQISLNEKTTKLDVSATTPTSGLAVVSLTCNFYQDPAKVVSSFDISYEFTKKCQNYFFSDVCIQYIPSEALELAIVSVKLPSGFVYADGVREGGVVRKIEFSKDKSLGRFYVKPSGKTCFTIQAYRNSFNSQIQDGYIIANDFYDAAKEGLEYFKVSDLIEKC